MQVILLYCILHYKYTILLLNEKGTLRLRGPETVCIPKFNKNKHYCIATKEMCIIIPDCIRSDQITSVITKESIAEKIIKHIGSKWNMTELQRLVRDNDSSGEILQLPVAPQHHPDVCQANLLPALLAHPGDRQVKHLRRQVVEGGRDVDGGGRGDAAASGRAETAVDD